MKMMNKFLQEFNRDLSEPERQKLLKKHYKAKNFILNIYSDKTDVILNFNYIDKRGFDMTEAQYLTSFIRYKTSDWKQLISKYEVTINGRNYSQYSNYDSWSRYNSEIATMRLLYKRIECVGFVSGVDLVFTNFKGLRQLKIDDYLVTRVDPIKWEDPRCKSTKEQNYI